MTVLVTGTNFAAVTDVNGGYTVRVPGSGAEIVYSYIGYQSQQRIVGSQTVINLALQESTAEIGADRKSTRLNSSHRCTSRMPSSA